MPTFSIAARNAALDQANARQLAQFARETGEALHDPDQPRVLSLLGDERQLRGIPAIGRGVQGVIAGTSPHSVR